MKKQEKTIKLIDDFSNNIFPKCGIVYNYFADLGLSKNIESFEFLKFETFTQNELNLVSSRRSSLSKNYIAKYKKSIEKKFYIEIKKEQIAITDAIYGLLNELECMCMCINQKIVSEKYLYKSLNQQFFKIICLTYIAICSVTDTNDKKNTYYPNIIKIFNIWKNRYIKKIKIQNFKDTHILHRENKVL